MQCCCSGRAWLKCWRRRREGHAIGEGEISTVSKPGIPSQRRVYSIGACVKADLNFGLLLKGSWTASRPVLPQEQRKWLDRKDSSESSAGLTETTTSTTTSTPVRQLTTTSLLLSFSMHSPHIHMPLARRLQLHQRIVRALRIEVAVKEQRVVALTPRVRVTDTPDRDTNALGLVEAALDGIDVVGGARLCDVQLGDGDFLDA